MCVCVYLYLYICMSVCVSKVIYFIYTLHTVHTPYPIYTHNHTLFPTNLPRTMEQGLRPAGAAGQPSACHHKHRPLGVVCVCSV